MSVTYVNVSLSISDDFKKLSAKINTLCTTMEKANPVTNSSVISLGTKGIKEELISISRLIEKHKGAVRFKYDIPTFFGYQLFQSYNPSVYNVVYNNFSPPLNGAEFKGQCKVIAERDIQEGEVIAVDYRGGYSINEKYLDQNFSEYHNYESICDNGNYVIAMKIIEEDNCHLFRGIYPRVKYSKDPDELLKGMTLCYPYFKDMNDVKDVMKKIKNFVYSVLLQDHIISVKAHKKQLFPRLYEALIKNREKMTTEENWDYIYNIVLGGFKMSNSFYKISVEGEMKLMPYFTAFNHSCWPNCIHYVVSHKETNEIGLMVFANSNIKKGEELNISYINPLVKYKDGPVTGQNSMPLSSIRRREKLKTRFSFDCKCDRCMISSNYMKYLEYKTSLLYGPEKTPYINSVKKRLGLVRNILLQSLSTRVIEITTIKGHIHVIGTLIDSVNDLVPKYSDCLKLCTTTYLILVNLAYGETVPVNIKDNSAYKTASAMKDLRIKLFGPNSQFECYQKNEMPIPIGGCKVKLDNNIIADGRKLRYRKRDIKVEMLE